MLKEKLKTEKGKWDLERIARKCATELRKAGIPVQNLFKIHVTRDRVLFGRVEQCWFDQTYFELYLPTTFRSPKYELTEVRTVICHLLLHTVKGCMNHDADWKEYAEKVDRECGLHIIEQAEKRPEADGWGMDSASQKAVPNNERCCFLNYSEKLEELAEACSEDLKNIGLHVRNVSGIFISRTDFAYGQCRENKNGDFTIFVSDRYVGGGTDIIGLKSVLCHELLHTCPEDDSNPYTKVHGPKWRKMARKVERGLGYKLMSESNSDALKKNVGRPMTQYICPACGGYYNVNEERDKRKSVDCKWCHRRMNIIGKEDIGVIDKAYFISGEFQDELKMAGIPVRSISGIGYAPAGRPTGLHDNWNGEYSIDLPEDFRKEEMQNGDALKLYLCRELVRTCDGCGDYGRKWEEYVKKAEMILGLPME